MQEHGRHPAFGGLGGKVRDALELVFARQAEVVDHGIVAGGKTLRVERAQGVFLLFADARDAYVGAALEGIDQVVCLRGVVVPESRIVSQVQDLERHLGARLRRRERHEKQREHKGAARSYTAMHGDSVGDAWGGRCNTDRGRGLALSGSYKFARTFCIWCGSAHALWTQ